MISSNHKTTTLTSLILLTLFAGSVLTVLTLGARAYQTTTRGYQQNYEERTALSYIWSKIKNADSGSDIYTGTFHGKSALFIDEKHGDTVYRTLIYHHDGHVRELFCETGSEFALTDGTSIFETGSLNFQQAAPGLIKAQSGQFSICIYGSGVKTPSDRFQGIFSSGETRMLW